MSDACEAPGFERIRAEAVVLCAGLGTRLWPLTNELPKPLVPVGDRPLLAHISERLLAHGFQRAFVNTHHLSSVFEREIRALWSELEVSHEPVIRGTAGGVAALRPRFASDVVLVWNGDILTSPPIRELLELARETGQLCLAIRECPRAPGNLGIDDSGKVARLRGERFAREVTSGDYSGVCAVGAEALAGLPDQGCLIGDYALPHLRSGGKVHVVWSQPGDWLDIGDLESYLRANLRWLELRQGKGGNFVHPSATLHDGVDVVESVIGAGAELGGSGRCERCVVWPFARARAPLADAIVAPGGVVPVFSGS